MEKVLNQAELLAEAILESEEYIAMRLAEQAAMKDEKATQLIAAYTEKLKAAKTEQHKNRFKYGELYSLNYYKQVQEKGRSYYELYSLQRSEEVPVDYREIDFVCLRPDGCFESSSTVGMNIWLSASCST